MADRVPSPEPPRPPDADEEERFLLEDEEWIEDDGLVTLRGFGYWAFHEEKEFTPENWTDAQLEMLERAATMLERWLNENWPRRAGPPG